MNFAALDRTWIIAEIGVNHEGDEAVAADLIRKAAASGADAVKFQTYLPEHYVSTVQPDRRARTERFCLSFDAFRRLKAVADEAGVVFFSTPLDIPSVEFLAGLTPLFKISSGDITYLQLIRAIAATGKPAILSTGLSTPDEIKAAVDAFLDVRPQARTDGSFMLMHCVSAYPTPAGEVHLRNMHWLKDTFGLPVGYSDHTLGTKACELAVAAGAVSVEKHFTYRKEDQAFHDHALSADPADMRALVDAVREAELILGRYDRIRGESEGKLELHMRRSLAAVVDIPAGEPVRAEWLTHLRPQWGLVPGDWDKLVGRPLNRAITAGEVIKAEDLV